MQRSIVSSILIAITTTAFATDDTSFLKLLFKFDSHDVTKQAKMQLDALVVAGDSIIFTGFNIIGHCDQLGSINYNNKLSLKRANAVKKYLLKKGIGVALINATEGRGKSELATNKISITARQENRRVLILMTYKINITEPLEDPTKTISNTEEKPLKLIDKIKDTISKIGGTIVLHNINFIGARHVFLPQSYPTLQELLATMQSIPNLKIEIQGHICCSMLEDGFDEDLGTYDLSKQRAKAVYQYLFENGIAKDRMSYVGLAHMYPLTQERDEMEKMMNRRVEIKIISK